MTTREEKDSGMAKAILSKKNGQEVESPLIDTAPPKPNADTPRREMYVSLIEGSHVAIMNPRKQGEAIVGKQIAVFGLCPGTGCNEKLMTSDVQHVQSLLVGRGVNLECHSCGQHLEPMRRRIVSPVTGGN